MLILLVLTGCFETETEIHSVRDTGVQEEALLADVAGESAVCLALHGEGKRDIVAIGMDSGDIAPVMELPDEMLHGKAASINSLARVDQHLYWCGDEQLLHRVNLLTGAVDASTHDYERYCQSVTDVGGGIMVLSDPGVAPLYWYANWEDFLADHYTPVLANHRGSRIGRRAGEIVTAWHSTDYLERFDAASGTSVGDALLEGYDTWVWGLSGVGDRVFVMDDGRNGDGSDQTRIVTFDPSGTELSTLPLGEGVNPNGLTCSGPFDPDTFVDDDPTEGTGPGLEF